MENVELTISDMLKDLGIPANFLGYRYLKYAIPLVMENSALASEITKKVYPEVASHFKAKVPMVERAIRNAIEVGWTRGNVITQDRLFGYTVDKNIGRPTNGMFIATVADYLVTTQVYR